MSEATATTSTARRWRPFASVAGYRSAWLRADVIAGLTVWAVLVPESLAYASIAGVSPVIGLYAAPPALVLYAAFGSSRHLVVGPMSATAALSAAAVADVATGGDFVAFTAALAIVTGLLALLAGLLRLGFLASFISEPVLKGFIIGLALTIMIGQAPKLLGIEKHHGNFFEQLWGLVTHLGDAHGRTLAVGLVSLVAVLALRHLAPVVPGSLVAVAVGIAAVKVFDLADRGVEIVGHIDSGLPAVGLPDGVGAGDYLSIAGSAAAVMLIGFVEGLGAAKAYAARSHDEIDSNAELLGLAAANLGSGLCSGMVVNGSLSKSAVNVSAGARSQVSGFVVAAATVLTLLFLTGLFEDLPEATLAAVVIAAVVELVDIGALRSMYRLHTERLGRIYGKAARADFVAALVAMLGVLLFETLPGLILGIAVSLLLLLYRASKPHVAELIRSGAGFVDRDAHPGGVPVPGIAVLRIESGLFFANADAVRAAIRDAASRVGVHGVVLDAGATPFVDLTAVRMLHDLGEDLDRSGVTLAIAHELGQVHDVLAAEGLDRGMPIYPTVEAAVAALGPSG